jgi:antagonist of KipI
MADRQPTGGYPKIAYVASVDQPLLAQLSPGDTFTFSLIDMAEAQRLDARREQDFIELETQLQTIRSVLNNASSTIHA